jgi:hypothetical protein
MTEITSVAVKERILKRIIAAHGPIVIKDDQYDGYRIIDKAGVLCMDNCSPRENFSYSEDPIEVDVAWQHALTLCPDKIEKYSAMELEQNEIAGIVADDKAAVD